jgi:hypothetical protein
MSFPLANCLSYDIYLNKLMQLRNARRIYMKRYFAAVLSCIMIGLFLTACATATPDKRGYGGKKSMPKQAQEEVVPDYTAPQPK